jgi:hypothetical protein
MKKKIMALFGMFFILYTTLIEASPLNASEALELARKEQMIVSKIMKNIVLIGGGFRHKDRLNHEMKQLQIEYAQGVKLLKDYDASPAWTKMMERIRTQWDQTHKLIVKSPNKKYSGKYIQSFSKMKFAWNQPIGYLMKTNGISSKDPETLCSNTRTASVQLASLYLLRSWELKHPEKVRKAMMNIGKKIKKTFEFLMNSPRTKPEMVKWIKVYKKNKQHFHIMFDSDVYTPTIAIKRSDAMFEAAEKLMALYGKTSK